MPLCTFTFAIVYFLIWNILFGFLLLIGYMFWNFRYPDAFEIFDWFVFDLNKLYSYIDDIPSLRYQTIFHWAIKTNKIIIK